MRVYYPHRIPYSECVKLALVDLRKGKVPPERVAGLIDWLWAKYGDWTQLPMRKGRVETW